MVSECILGIQNTVFFLKKKIYKYKWFYHLAACFRTAVGHFPQSELSITAVNGEVY